MESQRSISFRLLERGDLPLLHRWFTTPHARRWFSWLQTLDAVEAQYLPFLDGREPVDARIVLLDGRPIGMVDWMRFGDIPELQRVYQVDDPDASNCDVLIGEADVVHRGLGPAIIRAFLGQIIFADPRITTCVIDPVPGNFVAIRAYEKVGFRFTKALPDDGEGNGLYLMELRREELLHPIADDASFHIRPARPSEAALARALDDDACALYAEAGVAIDETTDPAFFEQETGHWTEAAHEGRMLLACSREGEPIGFASLGLVDGEPHLQQVSVRRAWMKRGAGRALVTRAIRWSVQSGVLWITTWAHLPWNAPWYERMGFERVADADCGPALRAVIEWEKRALPAPEHRIAMRYRWPRP